MENIFASYARDRTEVKAYIGRICHRVAHSCRSAVNHHRRRDEAPQAREGPRLQPGRLPRRLHRRGRPDRDGRPRQAARRRHDRRARRRARRRDRRAHPHGDAHARGRDVPRRAPKDVMAADTITDLSDPAFGRLFTDVTSSWFRLEALQRYDVEYEREDFAAFLRGEQLDTTPGPWQVTLRDHVAAGRRLARVHVLEEPLSDYVRYELQAYVPNVDAGEDVRVLAVRRGEWPDGVPRHDFWLFD